MEQGRGVLTGKGDPRGDAIWASVERRQRPGLPKPWQGHLGSRTFPGPERDARNSSPGVGGRGGQFPHGSPALGFPRSPGCVRRNTRPRLRGTGARAGQSPAVDTRRGAQPPREGARGCRPCGPRPGRALGGRVGGAAPGSPLAPPRGPRRFRSSWGRPGSQDVPPGLYVAGKSLFLSSHYPGWLLLPVPGPGPARGWPGSSPQGGRKLIPTSSWGN